MRRTLIIASSSLLAACGSGPDISATHRAAAIAFVQRDQAPLSIEPVALWYSKDPSMLCGEVDVPARSKTIRFVYTPGTPDFGMVEKDESWSGAGDARGDQILYEGRQIFDGTWNDMCLATASPSRRIAGWFQRGSVEETGTPLINAYTRELLSKSKNAR